jgi:hypothetical protein
LKVPPAIHFLVQNAYACIGSKCSFHHFDEAVSKFIVGWMTICCAWYAHDLPDQFIATGLGIKDAMDQHRIHLVVIPYRINVTSPARRKTTRDCDAVVLVLLTVAVLVVVGQIVLFVVVVVVVVVIG